MPKVGKRKTFKKKAKKKGKFKGGGANPNRIALVPAKTRIKDVKKGTLFGRIFV